MAADHSRTPIGAEGEERAVRHLAAHGFRIVGRNVRTPRGEIDIVAWDDETLCFVEVKARRSPSFGGARGAVDEFKQARLWGAAEAYLAADEELWAHPPECRFDVVTVAVGEPDAEWACRLYRDAFRAGDRR